MKCLRPQLLRYQMGGTAAQPAWLVWALYPGFIGAAFFVVWYFILFAALPLPLIGPGLGLAGALAAGGSRRGQAPGLLLALALLLPTFILAQALLSVAGWAQQPLAEAGPVPPYAPWPAELLLAPVCYYYFRVLGNPRLRAPGAWRALLPGLGQVGLFAGVAVLELGCRPGPAGGPAVLPAPAAALLRPLVAPLAVACYVLLVSYGLRTLDDYQRYCRARATAYPGATGRPRPGQRALLVLLLLGFGLGLSFVAIDAALGPLRYSEVWYAFAVRAGLVFGLAVVGLQAGYALAAGPRHPAGQPHETPMGRPLPGRGGEPAVMLFAVPPRPLPNGGGEPDATPFTIQPHPRPLPGGEEELDEFTAAPSWLPSPAGEGPPHGGLVGLAPELLPWRARLLALMDEAQPWLEPELTLAGLAQRLGTNASVLSKVINQGCGQNFNDFVNTYRVAEARRKLADARFAHYSLVGIALESGFNSKSTFNRVFKKLTGQAPGEATRPKS